jgi:hypothetical protein
MGRFRTATFFFRNVEVSHTDVTIPLSGNGIGKGTIMQKALSQDKNGHSTVDYFYKKQAFLNDH